MGLDVKMPKMGESLAEGTLVKWHKRVGDEVRRDEPLFEISTDKVDTEVPAPGDGYLSEVLVAEGDTVPVNSVVCRISSTPCTATPAAPPPSTSSTESSTAEETSPASTESSTHESTATRLREKSSPLVRRLAAEQGIDLAALQGSGTQGRVTKEDFLQHIQTIRRDESEGTPGEQTSPSLPPLADQVEPFSVMRRNIAQRMIESRQTSAHVSTIFEVDMTEVRREREVLNAGRSGSERVSYFPFLLHAVAQELRDNRKLNASIEEDSVRLHGAIHIGVAVALQDGLVVPVVQHADTKSVIALAKDVRDLATRARTKRLLPQEVQGATFTVTNPGVFGSLIGTPIIPQPQVAILCFGAVTKRPVVLPESDAIAVRSMSFLSLSFDHRLIDGAAADRFMAGVKKRLEATRAQSSTRGEKV